MSHVVEARVLLARFHGVGETPVVVASIDRTIWDHWDDADEEAWVAEGQRQFGLDPSDCEWTQVFVRFTRSDLAAAFETLVVEAAVCAGGAEGDTPT